MMRKEAGVESRNRLRRLQQRDSCQLPYLTQRIKDLETTCAQLEQELATARQRVAAFQHETFTLRSLIKLTDHPDRTVLVATAEGEAEKQVLREKVKELLQQQHLNQQEKNKCLLQVAEACDIAEHYKQLYKKGMPTRRALHGLSTTALPSNDLPCCSATFCLSKYDSKQQQLHPQSVTEDLEGATGVAAGEMPCAIGLSSVGANRQKEMTRLQATDSKEESCTVATTVYGPAIAVAEGSDSHRKSEHLLRLLNVLRSENKLLAQRLQQAVKANSSYIAQVSALKLENVRLQERVFHQ